MSIWRRIILMILTDSLVFYPKASPPASINSGFNQGFMPTYTSVYSSKQSTIFQISEVKNTMPAFRTGQRVNYKPVGGKSPWEKSIYTLEMYRYLTHLCYQGVNRTPARVSESSVKWAPPIRPWRVEWLRLHPKNPVMRYACSDPYLVLVYNRYWWDGRSRTSGLRRDLPLRNQTFWARQSKMAILMWSRWCPSCEIEYLTESNV